MESEKHTLKQYCDPVENRETTAPSVNLGWNQHNNGVVTRQVKILPSQNGMGWELKERNQAPDD